MGAARNVWLPGAGVWACLPQSSDAGSLLERDASPPRSVKVLHETHTRKRRKASSPSASCSRKDTGLDGENSSEVDESGLGFRVESRIRGDCQGGASSSSQEVMCAICLGNVEEAGEAVLQWCMHRFCIHCIEEWSRVRRVCPLCKAEFRGWYHSVQSNNEFQERILPPVVEPSAQLSRGPTAAIHAFSRRGRRTLQPRRQGVAAPDTAASSSSSSGFGRSVPFPTQRSFGIPRQFRGAEAMRVFEEQAAARALQWRQSIYARNLRARPFEIGKRSMCTKLQDAKARAERRLEPWLRRELQAVLPNSDHDFLVRLVLGLWLGAEHEVTHIAQGQGSSGGQHVTNTRNATISTEAEGAVEKAIKQLERFLVDKAELFWHELRCFAESPFTMQAYDTVVVYTRHDNLRRSNNRAGGRSSYQASARWWAESDVSRLTSRPLDNQEPNQSLRAGRHSIPYGQDTVTRDSIQRPQALLDRADKRKKCHQMDVYPSAEDRWQLSYC